MRSGEKPIERNRWRETQGGKQVSRRLQLPIPRRQPWAARLTPRAHGRSIAFWGTPWCSFGDIGGRTSAARERHTSRTPRVQLAWESNTLPRSSRTAPAVPRSRDSESEGFRARSFRCLTRAQVVPMHPLGSGDPPGASVGRPERKRRSHARLLDQGRHDAGTPQLEIAGAPDPVHRSLPVEPPPSTKQNCEQTPIFSWQSSHAGEQRRDLLRHFHVRRVPHAGENFDPGARQTCL